MKKRICILVICCLVFGITACQNTGDIPRSDSPSGESSATISEESDMQTVDNEQPEETVQQPEEYSSEKNDVQQPDSGDPIVYMTTDISPEGLMAVYEALGANPQGKIAVKIASGEPRSNYLRP